MNICSILEELEKEERVLPALRVLNVVFERVICSFPVEGELVAQYALTVYDSVTGRTETHEIVNVIPAAE